MERMFYVPLKNHEGCNALMVTEEQLLQELLYLRTEGANAHLGPGKQAGRLAAVSQKLVELYRELDRLSLR